MDDITVQGPAVEEHLTPRGRAFLDHCRALQAGDRLLPRARFDPMRLPAHLPELILVDVHVEGDPRAAPDAAIAFTYRVVGTAEVEVRRRDPTGKSIDEEFFGGSLARVRTNYLTVFRSGAPLLDREAMTAPSGRPIVDVSLYLPMGGPDGIVTQILVHSEQLER
jgi:hypothetical protein